MQNNDDDDDHQQQQQQQSLPRSPVTHPHSPQLDPTLYDRNQETHKNKAQSDDVLDLLLNNGGSYGEFSSCEVSKSSGELVGSSGLGELGLGFNNSGFVGGSLGLIDEDNEKCSRYQVLKSSEELVRSTGIDELGLGVNDSGFNFEFGSEIEFARRSLRLNDEEIGKCGWYEVSRSSGELVRSSENDELGLGLNNSGCDYDSVSKAEIVGRSSSLNGDDFGECSMYEASKSSGDVFRSSGSDELGLGLINSGCDIDFGSEIEITGGSSRLIDEDNDKCSMYEVSKSSGELINLSGEDKLGGGLNNTADGFDCGDKAEIVGKSSGLIGEDFGECSMYEVSKSSEELVKFDELGLGSNNSAVNFEHESKTEIFGNCSGLIDEDNGECSMYEVSKSSEKMGRCLESEELGLGLDNSAVDFDCESKNEIVGNSSWLIGEDNGKCSMYEVSNSSVKMFECLKSKELGLGLDNPAVDFGCGSKTGIVGNSSGLIVEDNGECSMYEVSKYTEKMGRCLESKELDLGLDNPAVDSGCEKKTEIVGNSSGLIGEDNGKRSMYEVSKSSEEMFRCLESKELGLGLDNSAVDFGCGSKTVIVEKSSGLIGEDNGECCMYEVSNYTEEKGRCLESKELALGLDSPAVDFDCESKTEIVGNSSGLIGEDNGECSMYEVSNSSEKMVRCLESKELDLGLDNPAVDFGCESKTEIVGNSSGLIVEDNGECSMYEVSKSSEKIDRCSESNELGLGSDNPDVVYDGGFQSESPKNKVLLSDERTVRRSPRTIGSSNGVKSSQCSQNKVSNTTGKMNNKSSKDKVLSLSDERRRSPRLIGSSNGVDTVERSSYKVSNSSGKLVPSSKSMKSGLESNISGVNSAGLSKNKSPKNKVVLLTCDKTRRKSPRLMDSAKGECIGPECSVYTSSNTSSIVNGKRELFSLLSSGDKVKMQVSNKKMKKSDCDIREGERRSSRQSGLKREPVDEVELNLEKKAALQLIKSEESNGSKGKSGTKCLDSNLLKVESLEDKVLRRSPRGLPSTFAMDDDDAWDEIEVGYPKKPKKKKIVTKKEEPKVRVEKSNAGGKKNCFFIGEPIPEEEALQKWGWRYQLMKSRRSNSRSLTGNVNEDDEPILDIKCHYAQAQIKGCIFHLGDCASIRGDNQKHVGRIVEFFQTTDSEDYFRVQWFYKPQDTVMKEASSFHDKKRLFYSGIMNDNLLACIISKVNVIQVSPQVNCNSSSETPSDFYYNMEYCLDYSTFRNLPTDNPWESSNLPSLGCPESTLSLTSSHVAENSSNCETCNAELTMLDLYAGCGAMSTGLCIGAKISGVNLVTRWAIDADSSACESLRLNHSNVDVKNETAEDFLELLKQWERLCKKFVSKETQIEGTQEPFASQQEVSNLAEACSDAQSDSDIATDELEVASLVDICYGNTNGSGESGLKFKVRWKGYGPSEDTWEPVEGLSNCPELIQEFVINGFKNKILPLPGSVDVICGGPPCQGISGYNRFRSVEAPLDDERNQQLVVFMDVVEYLRPKFVLMENVMDIIRFDKGSLGRYAMSRLVHMNYQARVGIMAAGCYGLPQYRLRTFFWGALPSEQLPQFPLPTHDVVARYWPPAEFERNVVAYVENLQPPDLEDAVFLGDAISDLPAVTNYEGLDEMPYTKPPETEFQKYIRSTKNVEAVLYDHRPHQLFEDDYLRVCQIPRRKGANFRDLPGVIVGDDNVVRRDPTIETVFLPSGMPLVPEYAFTFEQGKSKRPFARLWWDENVATIVTYPNCHSSAVLHPEQDRVLTVRECARLQGFPDGYRFSGTVKQRYRQVGNAVAIPVAKALGYALGMASQKLTSKESLLTLPPKFAYSDHL